jgi:hypothetical protein
MPMCLGFEVGDGTKCLYKVPRVEACPWLWEAA